MLRTNDHARTIPQSRHDPAPLDARVALKAWIDAEGEAVVQASVGLSRQTTARVIAGLPVARGSLALLREALLRRG